MDSTTGKEIVATKMKAESSDLVIVDGDEYALVDSNKRRAHICCGCDTRNAVFVVDSIGLCFYTLMAISFWLIAGDTLNYDDDQVQSVMDTLENTKMGFAIATSVIGIICNIIAIVGAAQFNMIATVIGGMWFLFETVRSLVIGDVVGAVIAACFCYPHAVFYHELKNGVMSRENYPKEKICCDCCCNC